LLDITFEPNGRRTAAFVNVNDRLEHVMLRLTVLAGGNLADIRIVLLLLAHVQITTQRTRARPRLHFDIHQIFDKKTGHRRDAFLLLKGFVRRRP